MYNLPDPRTCQRLLYLGQGGDVGQVGVGVLLLGQQLLQLQHAGHRELYQLHYLHWAIIGKQRIVNSLAKL